ncbi:hypothetical protein [Streptomyces africanus]|nr:hypothetical protein [Streptomyces africanus]
MSTKGSSTAVKTAPAMPSRGRSALRLSVTAGTLDRWMRTYDIAPE